MGWPAGEDGIVPPNVRDNSSGLRPIQIAMNQQASFPTSRITMPVNLPASDSAPSALGDPSILSIAYFDTLGLPGTLEATFQPTGTANTWTMSIEDQASGTTVGEYELVFDTSPGSGGTLASVTALGGSNSYDPANRQRQPDGWGATNQHAAWASGRTRWRNATRLYLFSGWGHTGWLRRGRSDRADD